MARLVVVVVWGGGSTWQSSPPPQPPGTPGQRIQLGPDGGVDQRVGDHPVVLGDHLQAAGDARLPHAADHVHRDLHVGELAGDGAAQVLARHPGPLREQEDDQRGPGELVGGVFAGEGCRLHG